jgi:hypothetical protein
MVNSNSIIKIITFLIICFTLSSGFSQIGIRAGLHMAKQEVENGNLDDQISSRAGFDIGLIVGISLTNSITIQPEVHFLQKGYKLEDLADESIKTLNYLEVPVTLKLNFGANTTNFFVQMGPSLGYLIDGSLKYGDIKEDIVESDYERLELGGLLGAGVRFGKLAVDVRYLLGISGTIKDGSDRNTYNRGLGAGVTLLF